MFPRLGSLRNTLVTFKKYPFQDLDLHIMMLELVVCKFVLVVGLACADIGVSGSSDTCVLSVKKGIMMALLLHLRGFLEQNLFSSCCSIANMI